MSRALDQLTESLHAGEPLDRPGVESATSAILDESVESDRKAAFLKALADKGETPEEIACFVDAFLGHAVDPGLEASAVDGPMIDVCGTGGDKLDLFNVSTTSIFVLAACGACVVKHGNRGITSKAGGADVLEALGVRIDLAPDECAETIRRHGVGFMFAPIYHPAFKAVVPVRQQLAKEGRRTIFNILGPLLNPTRPAHQLVGVFSPDLTTTFAEILKRLGRRCAWAVNGSTGDGRTMDELSTLATTETTRLHPDGSVEQCRVDPAALGIPQPELGELQGGASDTNAAITTAILDGSDRGPKRDIVALNSAAALVVAGLAPDLPAGFQRALEALESGTAHAKLKALQQASANRA